MKCTYEFNNKTGLTEKELMQEILANPTTQNEIIKLFSLGTTFKSAALDSKPDDHLDAMNFIYNLRKVDGEVIISNEGTRLLPEYNANNRLESIKQQYLEEHPHETIPQTVIDNAKARIEQDEIKGKVSGQLHKIIVEGLNGNLRKAINSFVWSICPYYVDKKTNIVTKKTDYNEEVFKAVFGEESKYFTSSNLTLIEENIQKISEILYNKFNVMINTLKNSYGSNYVSGKWYQNDADKVSSKIEFIGEDQTNEQINVIEFAIGSDNFDDWDASKRLRWDYKLGLDRSILISNGIPFEKINLILIPIQFDYGKLLDSLNFGKSNIRSASQVTKSGLGKNGEITQNLNKFTHPKPHVESSPKNLEKISEGISALTKGKWTPRLEKNISSIDQMVEHIKNKPKEKGKFVLRKYVGREYKKVLVSTEEELRKEVEKYFKELESDSSELMADIVKVFNIRKANATNRNNIDISDLLGTYKNPEIKKKIQDNFKPYMDGDWILLDNPELLANKMIVLWSKKTGVIDTFVLTSDKVDTKITLQAEGLEGVGDTVLGAYLMNDEAYRLDNKMPLATVGNLEILKVLQVYNSLPNLFKQAKLGNITCMSVNNPQSVRCDDNLKKSFHILTKLAKLENNYESGKIKEADQIFRLQNEMNIILSRLDNSSLSSSLTKNMNNLILEEGNKQDKIKKIEEMIAEIENAYNLQTTKITDSADFSRPEIYLLGLFSEVLANLRGLSYVNEERISNYGVSFKDIFGTFVDLFKSNKTHVDKSGRMLVGSLQGSQLSGSANQPSTNLSNVSRYVEGQILKLGRELNLEAAKIQRLTIQFYKDSGRGTLTRFFIGDNYDLYNNLFEKDDTGRISQDFQVKNPFDLSNSLTNFQRDYLKNILWQIHKFNIKGLSETDMQKSFEEIKDLEVVQEFIKKGNFIKVPLKRASDLGRFHNMRMSDIGSYASKKLQELQDEYDLRKLDTARREYFDTEKQNHQKYPDLYGIDEITRQKFLDAQDVYYWETNLDVLAMDVAFSALKRTIFTDTLSTIRYILWSWKKLSFQTGLDLNKVLQFLEDQIKITIFNESILDDEFEDLMKVNSVVRKVNSVIKLALRGEQWVKEMTVGTFRNWNIALTNVLKGTEYNFTLSDIKNAEAFMIGHVVDRFNQVIKADDEDIASFTLLNGLNNTYRIANMDINTIVQKLKTDRYGFAAGFSKWMYWANTNPDLHNRMKMFVAQMFHDGCLKAHTIKDGVVVYDMSKDDRFSEYYAHRNEKGYTSKNFQKQKALYTKMMEEFIAEGSKNDKGELLKMGDDLPVAYTTRQRNSLKELSDTMYGCYDHEAKIQLEHKLFGLLMLQFKTYWSGAQRRWFAPTAAKTSRGNYVQGRELDGTLRYLKHIPNADGSYNTIVVHEGDPEYDEYCIPEMLWQGDLMEGCLVSIVKTLRDSGYFLTNSVGLTNHKLEFSRERLANCTMGLHDLFMGYLFCLILDLIFFGESSKEHFKGKKEVTWNDDDFVALKIRNMVNRATNEFGIDQTLPFNSWEPTQIQSVYKAAKDLIGIISDSDPDLGKIVRDNVLSIQDVTTTKVPRK